MRGFATITAIAVMTAACHAQPLAGQAVALFKETCVDPPTPEAMIAAGEKAAATGKWKLNWSGPAPLPMMHMDRGPKISYAAQWELGFPEMLGTTLSMSIVRPPTDDIPKFSTCVMHTTTELGADVLAAQIEQQFGPDVTKDVSGKNRDQTHWVFTTEKAAGNCGRKITTLFNQMSNGGTSTTLMFTDVEFAKKWPASQMSKCTF